MIVSERGRELIKKYMTFLSVSIFDGKRKLYKIGYQTFIYPNGLYVRKWQTIEEPEALRILNWYIDTEAMAVYRRVSDLRLNQFQFDALVSFSLSLSTKEFDNSTLLEEIRKDKDNKYIRICFVMERAGNEKRQSWIKQRREAEARHYFQNYNPVGYGWKAGRTENKLNRVNK